MQLVNI